jgi:hypothetical protein
MGSLFSPKVPKENSEAKRAREAELKRAELEAERNRELRIADERRRRGGLLGRQSLIGTSELGVTEKLGS